MGPNQLVIGVFWAVMKGSLFGLLNKRKMTIWQWVNIRGYGTHFGGHSFHAPFHRYGKGVSSGVLWGVWNKNGQTTIVPYPNIDPHPP